jgi:hypothetical protein
VAPVEFISVLESLLVSALLSVLLFVWDVSLGLDSVFLAVLASLMHCRPSLNYFSGVALANFAGSPQDFLRHCQKKNDFDDVVAFS